MSYPTDRKYSADHEWILVDGDVATVGITNFAASALGDVVYVDLPSVGDTFAAGDSFGEVESVKSVSDLFIPVDGEVVAFNEELEGAPDQVNSDPYGNGWMVRIRLTDASQVDALLDAEAYEAEVSA